MTAPPAAPAAPLNKGAVFAWMLYDFANQGFTTLVVTFIYAPFFISFIAPDEIAGTRLWAWGTAISAVAVALLSPYMGAIADRSGLKKPLLLIATVLCIGATGLLYLPGQGQVGLALTLFAIANITFGLSYVFYNAFLPDLGSRAQVGRISGYGWAFGYLGGLLTLIVALGVFVFPDPPLFGMVTETGSHIRATNLLVAGWYAVFAIPLFVLVPETRRGKLPPLKRLVQDTNRQLWHTFRDVRQYRQAFWLLAAKFFYNDGLVTIFAFGGVYAAGTFGFDTQGIILFGIVLNVAAGLGALAFGYVDDAIGGKPVILITLVGLTIACLMAVLAPNRTWFWIAGILIGILVGPNQSSSRSLLSRLTPAAKQAEFFGFFSLSSKLTSFQGPLLLGWVTDLFGSQRAGVATVVIFFIVGGLLLLRVDEAAGVGDALAADAQIQGSDGR